MTRVISKAMTKRIQKIAATLKYHPNAAAYSLRKKFNRSIALVLPEMNFAGGEFFQEIIRGIDEIVEKHNFIIVITKLYGKENLFHRIAKERRIDGAIVLGDVFKLNDLKEINAYAFPITIANYRLSKPLKNIIDIYSDNELGGKIAAEHLIVTHNRKNILFLGGSDRYQANSLRKKGFMRTAEQHNIKTRIIDGKFETGFKDGQEIIKSLLQNNEFNFDAIFAASDALGIGALKILQKNNIKIPEDVSLITYDNTQITNFYPITITSVEQNAYMVGYKSAELTLNRILNKEQKTSHASVKISPQLIIRESCGCPAESH